MIIHVIYHTKTAKNTLKHIYYVEIFFSYIEIIICENPKKIFFDILSINWNISKTSVRLKDAYDVRCLNWEKIKYVVIGGKKSITKDKRTQLNEPWQ